MFFILLFLVKLFIFSLKINAFPIKGFTYGDNKSVEKWVEGKNGYAVVEIADYFPDVLSVCLRGSEKWHRNWVVGWFNLNLNIPNLREKYFPNDFAVSSFVISGT